MQPPGGLLSSCCSCARLAVVSAGLLPPGWLLRPAGCCYLLPAGLLRPSLLVGSCFCAAVIATSHPRRSTPDRPMLVLVFAQPLLLPATHAAAPPTAPCWFLFLLSRCCYQRGHWETALAPRCRLLSLLSAEAARRGVRAAGPAPRCRFLFLLSRNCPPAGFCFP